MELNRTNEGKRLLTCLLCQWQSYWSRYPDVGGSGIEFYGILAVSSRVIVAKLKASPFNITLVQVHAPTTEHSEEEINEFYEQRETAKRQAGSQKIL